MCNEKLGTEQNSTPDAVPLGEWCSRYDAITSDMHALPLVFATGASLEDLFEQINFWVFDGDEEDKAQLSEASLLVIKNAVQLADCPNDGMFGTMLTKPITVPELSGMVFHIQLT